MPTDTADNVATTLHIATLAIAQSVVAQGLAGYAQDFFRKSFLPVKGNSKIFYYVKNFSGTRYPPLPLRASVREEGVWAISTGTHTIILYIKAQSRQIQARNPNATVISDIKVRR